MNDLIRTLRRKGFVEVDEHLIEYAGEWPLIEKGDRYLGQHGDDEPELLTCRRREVQHRSSGRRLGKFFPKERKDSQGNQPRLYSLNEVIKVIIRENPNYKPDKKGSRQNVDNTHYLRSPFGDFAEPEGDSAALDGAVGVSEDVGPRPAADDRDRQRENGSGHREADKVPAAKPGPRPGPKPDKRGAEHRDPRQPAGRTDYAAAGRKSS